MAALPKVVKVLRVILLLKVTEPVEAAVASCKVKVWLEPLRVLLKVIAPELLFTVRAPPKVAAPL